MHALQTVGLTQNNTHIFSNYIIWANKIVPVIRACEIMTSRNDAWKRKQILLII